MSRRLVHLFRVLFRRGSQVALSRSPHYMWYGKVGSGLLLGAGAFAAVRHVGYQTVRCETLEEARTSASGASFQAPRIKLRNEMFKLLRPTGNFKTYGVIFGATGSGKTAIAKRVVHDLEDGDGVVFMDIPADRQSGVLGYTEKTFASEWLKRSTSYYGANHKPLVLVVDSVSALRGSPELVTGLQQLAKTGAEQGTLRVVFVCDAEAVQLLQASPALWAAGDAVEVPELSELEAMQLLAQFGVSAEDAKQVVLTLTGGNLGLLHQYLKDPRRHDVARLQAEWTAATAARLSSLPISEWQMGLKLLTDKKSMSVREAADYFTPRDLRRLVGSGVLAYHSAARGLRFHDRQVERYFLDRFGKT